MDAINTTTSDSIIRNISGHVTEFGNMTSLPVTAYDPVMEGTLPTIVFVSILSVIGAVGNTHVLIVFIFKITTKSTYTTYVIALAFIDLMVSAVHMPCEILDLQYPFGFWNPVSCRLFRYNNFFLSTISVMVIFVVAMDRHKRVCRPLGKQWSVRFAKKLLLGCVPAAALLCSPSLLFFGERTVDINSTMSVETCFINNEYKDSYIVVGHIGFIYVTTITVGIYLVYAYVSIGLHMRKQFLERAYLTHKIHDSTNIPDAVSDGKTSSLKTESVQSIAQSMVHVSRDSLNIVLKTDSNHDSNAESHLQLNGTLSQTNKNCGFGVSENAKAASVVSTQKSVPSPKRRSISPSKEAKKITKITFIITIVFIICHVPYLSFGIILGIYPEFKRYLSVTELSVYRFAMRLLLVNNVCNPFIYGIFDNRFKNLCQELYHCSKSTNKK